MFFLGKKLFVHKTFLFKKKMLPFGKKKCPKTKLAPKTIGKQIFEFLIFKFVDIGLVK
jgi:hypothetical protein